MLSVNDRILDEITGHSVDLQRLEASVKFKIRKELKKLERGLIQELNDSNMWDAKREQTKLKRLKVLLKQTKETIKSTYSVISKDHIKTLTGVAALAEKQAVKSINKAINFELASVTMSKQMLKAIASDTLFEGAPSKEWWARRSEAFHGRFADTVRQGMMRGETTDQIISNLVGTKVNRYKDAAFFANFRSADALVRTSIQSVANESRLMTYADNDDIIKEIEWVSTLDSRTSDTCKALDGLKWKNPSREPVGHNTVFVGTTAHWGCRSTQVPITKSWEELGAKGDFNEIPESTRASMDGQVSSKLGYEGWLKSKPEKFQRDVLGSTKFDLWNKGNLKFTDMVNQSGNALTLSQLNIKLDKPKKIVKTVREERQVFRSRNKAESPSKLDAQRERSLNNYEEGLEAKSPEEAFGFWTTSGYQDYKVQFAEGNLTSKATQIMKETFEKLDGNHDGSMLYRGMSVLRKNEVFSSATGTKTQAQLADFVENLKVGDVVNDITPLSFTKSDEIAKEFIDIKELAKGDVAVMFKVKGVKKQGYDISDLSTAPWEQEVVIKPSSRMRIISITTEGKDTFRRNFIDIDLNDPMHRGRLKKAFGKDYDLKKIRKDYASGQGKIVKMGNSELIQFELDPILVRGKITVIELELM
jgi:hypothetical protein